VTVVAAELRRAALGLQPEAMNRSRLLAAEAER
jgi:hypothetical protein